MNAITIMLNYEPTLPLHPPPPTTHYLAVLSSSSSSTNANIVRHCRHHRHHRVGCCLVPPAATPTSSPLSSTADQPHQQWRPRRFSSSFSPPGDPPPPRCRRAFSALSIAHGAVRHASWTGMRRRCPPSRSDASSAAPARAPLVGIWAHCTSATVTTAAMPRFPLWRPAVDPPLLLGPPPPVG